MPVAARLKQGELLLAGQINERLPMVTNGLVAHYPFDGTDRRYVPGQIRYIRDWLNGSSANTNNHWVELQAFDFEGNNVARNKSGTSSDNTWNALLTNNVTTSDPYWNLTAGVKWVQVDLGGLHNLKEIKVWHYWADGRTYKNTKTEVSSDGINWFAVFDSAIEGTYKETSAGHSIDLISNPTLLPSVRPSAIDIDGVAMEPVTENKWTGTFSVYNNYSQPTTLKKLDETYLGEPVYRVGFTVTDPTRLSHFQSSLSAHGVVGGSLSWVIDTKYVSSVYWRPVNKPDMLFGGTASNTSGWSAGGTEVLENGWRRFYRFRTGAGIATRSDSVHHSFACPSLQLNEPIYFDVCCPQTEVGRIRPTSYVSGNRTQVNDLTIPATIGTSDFTITGEFIPNENSDELDNGAYFLTLGNGMLLRAYNKQPYIDGNTITGVTNNNVHLTYKTLPNAKVRYVIQREGTKFSWRMIAEDGQDVTWVKDHANVATKVITQLVFSSTWAGRHRNISIYHRVLTADEIQKLMGKPFDVRSDGNMFTKRLIEKPTMPVDALHIPLDFSTKDRLNFVGTSSESNLVFEDGCVWVGTTEKGELEFNLNRDYGLNWGGEWSIVYWKKPVGTNGGKTVLTNYNIDSLGCNSNSVGGGYTWWGKQNGSNTIANAAPSAITPETYFNNWRMISLVKSGTVLTTKEWAQDGTIYVRSQTITSTAANFFVTPYGYDLKLGGHDNANPSNTYFKNLVVAKRAFTDNEVATMFGTQMRAYKTHLQVQNGMKENQIF